MTKAVSFFETLLPKNEIYVVEYQNKVQRTKNVT